MEMIGKVWQSRFFSFLYIKSKTAFKPSFRTLSKLAEQLKIRVRRELKKGLYYEINFIFIIFKKLLRHQPGTQKSGALIEKYDIELENFQCELENFHEKLH